VKRLAAFAALALLTLPVAEAMGRRPPPLLAGLPQSEVQAVTTSGAHRFRVWIAADQSSRERGLMFVREMPADWGMLFLFERPQYVAFWMKNTYLSLDLVFVRGDGTVSDIARAATPGSLEPIPSSAPVVAVLELLAGTAERIGLLAGDRVVLPDRTGWDGHAGGGERGH
jgi:uncharacterized membrane protein (UPF0127 family)